MSTDFDIASSDFCACMFCSHFLHGLILDLAFFQAKSVSPRAGHPHRAHVSKKLEVFLYCWIKTSCFYHCVSDLSHSDTPPRLMASKCLECLIQGEDSQLPVLKINICTSQTGTKNWFLCVSHAIPVCHSNVVRQPRAVCMTGILRAVGLFREMKQFALFISLPPLFV